MYVTDRKSIRIAIVGAIAAGFLQVAHALGLGPITVNSHIGEPLRASINVTGLDAAQRANTTVSIASNEAYRSRGIEKLPSHKQLNLSLRPSASGHYINISTPNVVREPFITFVLSIKHEGKETLREYTVFLDPAADGLAIPPVPPQEMQMPAMPAAPAKVKLLTEKPASTAANGWKGATPEPVAVAPVVERQTVGNWQGRNYGPVQKGETLFSIAEKVRPSSDYSIQTVMRQIYRANPRAFSSNQLSSLMAGYNLSIPVFTKELVAPPSRKQRPSAPVAEPTQPEQTETVASASITEQQDIESTEEQTIADNISQDENKLQESLETDEEDIDLDGSESGDAQVGVNPALQNILVDADQNVDINAAFSNDPQNERSQENATINLDSQTLDQAGSNDRSISLAENAQIDVSDSNSAVSTESAVTPGVTNQPISSESVTTQPVSEPVSNTQSQELDLVVEDEPVVEEQPAQSFLNTTYAFLPMWQWLLIAALLFGMIALLLFKQRKKHAVDEFDALDDEEMDAVLAKINQLEDEDHTDGDDAWLSDHGAKQDSGLNQSIEQAYDSDPDMVFDEAVHHENEPHDHELHDFESDSDMFFNEEEHDLNQATAIAENNAADIDDDYDFFVDDDEEPMSQHIDTIENSDFEDSTEQSVSTESHQDVADDDLDFFISDEIENAEPAAVEGEKHVVNESSSWADQDDDLGDLDDLFMSDSELESGDDGIADNVHSMEPTPVLSDKTDSLTESDGQSATANFGEMEINLDLAESFIATGHGERATIWLEEVIEAGTEEQKERAKALLDKVRGA